MEFAKFVKDVMKGKSKDYQLELILQNAKVYEDYNISENELLEICNELAMYMSNFNIRMDSRGHLLHYPQVPYNFHF